MLISAVDLEECAVASGDFLNRFWKDGLLIGTCVYGENVSSRCGCSFRRNILPTG